VLWLSVFHIANRLVFCHQGRDGLACFFEASTASAAVHPALSQENDPDIGISQRLDHHHIPNFPSAALLQLFVIRTQQLDG